jgi:hypothetical protein
MVPRLGDRRSADDQRSRASGDGRAGAPDRLLVDRGYDDDRYRSAVRGAKPMVARSGTEHGSGLDAGTESSSAPLRDRTSSDPPRPLGTRPAVGTAILTLGCAVIAGAASLPSKTGLAYGASYPTFIVLSQS